MARDKFVRLQWQHADQLQLELSLKVKSTLPNTPQLHQEKSSRDWILESLGPFVLRLFITINPYQPHCWLSTLPGHMPNVEAWQHGSHDADGFLSGLSIY